MMFVGTDQLDVDAMREMVRNQIRVILTGLLPRDVLSQPPDRSAKKVR